MIAKGFNNYQLTEPYNTYFQLFSNFDLDESVLNVFSGAMNYVVQSKYFHKQRKRRLIVFLSITDNIEFVYDNKEQYGSQFDAAVILYHRMKNMSNGTKILCIVEEFVHHFWDEADEMKTSQIVCSLLPGITCDENGRYIDK